MKILNIKVMTKIHIIVQQKVLIQIMLFQLWVGMITILKIILMQILDHQKWCLVNKKQLGDYNSEGGYFWISYEDKTLMSDIDNFSIKGGKKPNDDEKMYQHDYASIVPLISKDNSCKCI